MQLDGTLLEAVNNDMTTMPSSVPTISSVTPSVGSLAGGFAVTIAGSLFSATATLVSVMLGSGGTPCMVLESSTTSITCTTGTGAIGTGPVTVSVEGGGVSDVSSSPQFRYELSVDSVSPSFFGFGGGNLVTVTGAGFLSAGAASTVQVSSAVAIAGRETYVVGVYVPTYTPEIHEILLTADWHNGYYLESNPPTGSFDLQLGGSSVGTLTPAASAADVQQLVASISYFGHVDVVKQRGIVSGEQTDRWVITYSDLRGVRDLLTVHAAGLTGGVITINRVQTGEALVNGEWQLKLGGRVSQRLSLNATEEEVRQVVSSAFPEVLDVAVIAAENMPGKLLDRVYPRQWAIKLQRQNLAGASRDRCVNPLYVDWDPTACPASAANLFLNYYPWYFPSQLPKPGDLGTHTLKADMLEACENEARAMQLRPAACQALIPPESLPMCGEGSGINPPCWIKRFTTARVRHASDGSEVVYERNDAKSASDSVRGYRFWERPDLLELQQMQTLTVNDSMPLGSGSGVDVRTVFQRAEEILACAGVSNVTYTSMRAKIPSMLGLQVSEMVLSDFIFKPTRTISFSPQESNLVAQSDVKFGKSLYFNGFVAKLGSGPNSGMSTPFTGKDKTEKFTVELWLKANRTGATFPILQDASQDSGFALMLSGGGEWQFYMNDGSEFSVVSGPATHKWSHIALSYDGAVQRLFVDGTLHSSLVKGYKRNTNGDPLYIAGPCGSWFAAGCGQGTMASIELDEALFYGSAVPSSLILEHQSLLQQTLHAQFKVMVPGGLYSNGITLQVSAAKTARVTNVLPSMGWNGRLITVLGEGFELAQVSAVQLAGGTCDSISVLSDSRLTCTARSSEGGQASGPTVVVLEAFGASPSAAAFTFVSTIESVSPNEASRAGGINLTVTGLGIVSDAGRLRVNVGGKSCQVLAASLGSLVCRSAELSYEESVEGAQLPIDVQVDGKAALCHIAGGCTLTLLATSTPTLLGTESNPAGTLNAQAIKAGSTLIIHGNELPTVGAVEVHLGDSMCPISARTSSRIECEVGLGSGGQPRLRVRFAVGLAADLVARCCLNVTYEVKISSVTPSIDVSAFGGNIVTLSGSGFSALPSRNNVRLGPRAARILSASADTLVIQTPALGNAAWPSTQALSLTIDGVVATCNSTCDFAYDKGPVVTSVVPSIGIPGDSITLTGAAFDSSGCAGNTVSIGSTECAVQSCTNSSLACTLGSTGSAVGGEYPVRLSVAGSPAVGSQILNPPLAQRTFSDASPVRTSSMLDQTNAGGAWIPSVGAGAWMEIDAGEPMPIVGFVTQARGASYCR